MSTRNPNNVAALAVAALAVAALALAGPSAAAASEETRAPAPHSQAAFSFGLIADVQYWGGPTTGTRNYSESTAKLAAAAETINNKNVDFTTQLGDIIDRDAASFDTILPVWESIDGPRYSVLGNHDFPQMYSDEVVSKLRMSNEYYEWTHQNWRFVVLDTTDISLFANAPDTEDYRQAEETLAKLKDEGAVNAKSWNGAVGEEQLAWLAGTLDDAAAKDQKVIVFGHNPINGTNVHNAWDSPEIRKVLESRGNVAAYFNGHDHAGRYAQDNGIHYVNLKGMVEDAAPANAYAIVKVQQNQLRIDGFGNEPDRTLKISANAR